MQPHAQIRSLLLNASFEPMKIVSWQKALILWLQDKVEILEYHRTFARSARSSFQLPSVLKLKSYVKPRRHGAVRFCKENVLIRDNFTCQYCGTKLPPAKLTLDHVIPASKNGPKTWTNVVSACKPCNQRKGSKTPLIAGMPLLSIPSEPHWMPSHEISVSEFALPDVWIQYLRYNVG
jgi:5-methylcytosine-specific restriction endonuclease McrA